MFHRGQKIIIVESSADKKMHPRAGDVGYLDNMYLFVKDRFILLDAFFFQYKTDSEHNKNRVEKRRFIIDLGMKKSLKLSLNSGVAIKFFVNKYYVNLNLVGYAVIMNDLVEYPLIHSNYGIWNIVRRSPETDHVEIHTSEELYKIPYGQIALFSNKYNSKYRIEERSNNEFLAWIRSMLPAVSSMIGIFYDYRNGILLAYGKHPLEGSVGNCFSKAANRSSLFRKHVNYLFLNTLSDKDIIDLKIPIYDQSKCTISGYYILKSIDDLSKPEKAIIINDVNFINSLDSTFIQRLDTFYLNRFNEGEIKDYIKSLWSSKGILKDNTRIKEIMPSVDIVKSIFCRSIITNCDLHRKIDPILHYLPPAWNLALESKMANVNRIKLEASNNSSALNRIYEI